MNHYPRHIGDFAAATQGLTLAERGAYTALLDQYYAHELPLPSDKRECYRMAVATTAAERKAVDYVLGRYFTLQVDGWHQKRADAELVTYREKSAKASNSAAIGWSKRNANAMRTHSEGNASHKPVTSNHKPVETKAARKRAETPIPDDFGISDRVAKWAAGKGYGDLPRYLEIFIGRNRASGKTYLDWDDALMNAIREDWYELRGKPAGKQTNADRTAATAEAMYGNLVRELRGHATDDAIAGNATRVD